MDSRPRIEIVRVPSTERGNFRPLDGVQLRATYSHVRVGTYCSDPEPEYDAPKKPPDYCGLKVPHEQSRKYKKNLGPVSRLLRRRHRATSLATKSCDNICSVNKSNSFFEWKHGHSCHDQGLDTRQSNSLDWRVGRSTERNSSNFECRKASRSAEQLSRTGNLQIPSTKSKIVSLLRRLSPRHPRPSSKDSMPSSPSVCPWVQVEYTRVGVDEVDDGVKSDGSQSQENDRSFQYELRLNEIRKRAIQVSKSRLEIVNDKEVKAKGKKSSRTHRHLNAQIQEPQHSNSSLGAVHEERRGSSEERRVDPDPVHAPRTTGRRSRPHSLAVQPLNYQRLDPELLEPGLGRGDSGRRPNAAKHHPNMTSQESIGSCSLDVERSASDPSDFANAGSPSEKTLFSLSLSCNGEGTRPAEEEEEEATRRQPIGNGHQEDDVDQLTATKKPSYLGLACSISGYSGITRYDSKLREGFRSRDSSPGTRLITRDTSPAGLRSNETLNVASQGNPPKSQSISPLAMERHHNGFANGLRDKCKIKNYLDSGRSINSCQGYSEVDRAATTATTATTTATTLHGRGFTEQFSPVRAISPNKRNSPVGLRIDAYNQQNKTYSSPKSVHFNVSQTSHSDTSALNGGSTELESCTLNSSTSSEKSFIQQRVERLYGPGALAQGFFFKRSTANKLDLSNASNKSSNNNSNTSVDDTVAEESLKSLPVLRHLRPEFRAQLPVVSPRRPTDGTEQIIKPLKRISLAPGVNDAKEKKTSPIKQEKNEMTDSKMTASETSLTDQQPAAPKVVLPVLESSASLTNNPKQGAAEAPKKVQEKDGHYFTSLLNKERERLISLAVEAESVLSNSEATTLPEEAAGKLRSAAGKARLLASQKMKQFEGLCQKNINQVPGEEFPTTNEDLAGFWDMVMLQVVQVNDLFEQLERLRQSQWKEIALEKKSASSAPHNGSAVKRRQTPASKAKLSTNIEAAQKAREARERSRRQLIEEKRRAMRSNTNKSESSVEIFVPET